MKTKIEKCDVPEGSEERHGLETVSSPANPGNVVEAQPVVDGSAVSKPGHWIGDGYTIKRIEQE